MLSQSRKVAEKRVVFGPSMERVFLGGFAAQEYPSVTNTFAIMWR